MTEVIVGTKKGLFALEGDPGEEFSVTARAFAGEPIDVPVIEPRAEELLAHYDRRAVHFETASFEV